MPKQNLRGKAGSIYRNEAGVEGGNLVLGGDKSASCRTGCAGKVARVDVHSFIPVSLDVIEFLIYIHAPSLAYFSLSVSTHIFVSDLVALRGYHFCNRFFGISFFLGHPSRTWSSFYIRELVE